jgi:hypothetical protein
MSRVKNTNTSNYIKHFGLVFWLYARCQTDHIFSDHKVRVLSLCRTCSERPLSASLGTFALPVPFYDLGRYIAERVICLGSRFGRHFFSVLLILYRGEAGAGQCLPNSVHLPYLVDD